MKIYIAGPISGIEKDDCDKAFNYAEEFLKEKCPEDSVVNPIKVCSHLKPQLHTWNQYMVLCIEKLLECDGIYLLNGWEESKGARLEFTIAIELDLVVRYEIDSDFSRF